MPTTLRDVTLDDTTRLREWRRRPDVARYMFGDAEISEAEHAHWFARILSDPTIRPWVIVHDGADVGYMALSQIDERHGRCTWGFYVAEPTMRGQGVGAAAWFLTLDHAFRSVGMRRMFSEVLATNERAHRLHLRFGWVVEGHLRAHVLKDGEPVDVVLLGLHRDEWEAVRPTLAHLVDNVAPP